MQILKQSTQIKVRIGPCVSSTDGVTPSASLTIAAADQAAILKANGASSVALTTNDTLAATTGVTGYYDLTLTTSHTNTVGTLEAVIQDASLCLPLLARFQVVTASVYDAHYASGSSYPTNFAALSVTTGGNVAISQTFPTNFDALSVTTAGIVSIGQTFPTNFPTLSITTGGVVQAQTTGDVALTTGQAAQLEQVDMLVDALYHGWGTIQSITDGNTFVLTGANIPATSAAVKGTQMVVIRHNNSAIRQTRRVLDWDDNTSTVTLEAEASIAQVGNYVYFLSQYSVSGTDVDNQIVRLDADGRMGINWDDIGTPTATVNLPNTVIGTVSDSQLSTGTRAQLKTDLVTDYQLHRLFSNSITLSTANVANNSFAARLASKSAGGTISTFNPQTDSLEAISDQAVAVDNTAIADAVLSRSVANVETTMGEYCLGTIVLATLESAVTTSNEWNINRTNGSTLHLSKTLAVTTAGKSVISVS